MFGKKDKNPKDLEALRDIADDVEEDEFVPYACLFADDTILTKNGELLKTIKISGFTKESLGEAQKNLRQLIRDAIGQHTPSNAFAFWFHTMRRKRDLSLGGDFADSFSKQLDEAWGRKNNWAESHVNELYVTVVRRCENPEIRTGKQFMEGLLPSKHHKSRMQFLDSAKQELDQLCAQFVAQTSHQSGRLLTVLERDGVAYSEQLEFLEKLINLEGRPMALPLEDLSTYLTSGEITFAFNAMEVRTAEGKRRFATVLTLKDYKEASLAGIDRFLQTPCEFIVTQSFDFLSGETVRKEFENQQRFVRLSGDAEFAQLTELDRLMQQNDHSLSYGQQQTNMFVIAESVAELEKNVKAIRAELMKTGIISIREDLKFEECYWAQLPANFAFVTRQSPIDTLHVGGFANLSNEPMGTTGGSKWGKPVALFRTAATTPYYFNFHKGEVGHTMVVGPRGSGKSVLANFLLSQARKLPYRLMYCDAQSTAAPFVKALGGTYIGKSELKLNPFSLPDSPSNQEFLSLWVMMLAAASGIQVTSEMLGYFKQLVAYIYQLPESDRHLDSLVGAIAQKDTELAGRFDQWVGEGRYATLFTKGADSFATATPAGSVVGYDLDQYMHDVVTRLPVSSYVLQRLTRGLDGEPTLLMLDEAWWILDNPIFGPRLQGWFDHLTKKNAVAMLATENIEDAAKRTITPSMLSACPTHIFMPDPYPTEYYQTIFKLSARAHKLLGSMIKYHRQFLLRRDAEELLLTLDLDGEQALLDVLSGHMPKSADTMQAEIVQQPRNALWEEPA